MPVGMMDLDWETADKAIAPFGTLIKQEVARRIAAERERCAEIAESMAKHTGKDVADALRMGAVMTPTRNSRS